MTMYGQRCTVFETQGPSTAPADSLRESASSAQDDNVRAIVHRFRKHKVLRLRLPIHFVNPQGSAQDDNVRTKVHRFGNTRSFDCAADSLREPAGLRSG